MWLGFVVWQSRPPCGAHSAVEMIEAVDTEVVQGAIVMRVARTFAHWFALFPFMAPGILEEETGHVTAVIVWREGATWVAGIGPTVLSANDPQVLTE